MGVPAPENLSEDEFEIKMNEFIFLRNYDREFYLSIARQALIEILVGIKK